MTVTPTPTNIDTVSAQLLADITELQKIQLDLFNSLEAGIANNTLNNGQQDSIISQISQISTILENLYGNLDELYIYYGNNASSMSTMLTDQVQTIQIVENELNEAIARLQLLDTEKYNKLRQVEINDYYGEKYSDQASFMKTIVLFCIPIIIIAVLFNAGIIPASIFYALVVVIAVSAIITISIKLYYLVSHDNMNYQEFSWSSSAPNLTVDTSDPSGSNPWTSTSTASTTCVGQSCCPARYTYNDASNVCLLTSS